MGFSGFGGSSGRRDRAAIFRRERVVGEQVRGQLLQWVGEGLAWVDVGGHEMLARISSRPQLGLERTFLVVQLHPNVVLRELHGSGEGFSPGGLLHLYRTVRDEFERGMAAPAAWGGARGFSLPGERKKRFFENVARDPEALARYVRLLELVEGINGYVASTGERQEGQIWHLPWMVPGAMGQELLLRQWAGDGSGDDTGEKVGDSIWEVIFGFTMRGLGRAEVRLLVGPGRAGCRILLERMEFASAVERLIRASLPPSLSDLAGTPGVGPLPPGSVDLPGGLPTFNAALEYRHLDKRV